MIYLTQYNRTALHMASENGHSETVQLLLKKGADPNRCDQVRDLTYNTISMLYIYMQWMKYAGQYVLSSTYYI